MDELRHRWGQNIRNARLAAGLTQVEFAAAIGSDQRRISQWELGSTIPRDDWRPKIARALGVPVCDLFNYDDENGEAA